MAEIPMTGPSMASVQGKPFGALANLTGAALSLALIVGAGVWGYKILVRDVSGVPVVRAAEGPMRVQPDEPGGQPAAHQGLSVNDVAATGGATPPADRLVLAPAPIELEGEDQSAGVIEAIELEPVSLSQVIEPEAEPIIAPEPLNANDMDSIEALAAQIAAGAEQLADVAPSVVQQASVTVTETTAETARPTHGLKRSLRPLARPQNFERTVQLASLAADNVTVPTIAVRDVDPATIPAGTRLVQFGAYGSEDIAKAEWGKLHARFGDYLKDKDRVIQRATSGGRVFYRLRAMGFVDLSDARRLCSALKAENADCIPVVTR